MNKIDQRKNIRRFIDEWSSPSKGREISDNQPFWIALMRDVFGVAQPEALFQFERPVRGLGRIDALMEGAGVLIEQKGRNRSLNEALKQSDGSELTPYQQGKRYADHLGKRPRWVIACNFDTFEIHDLSKLPDETPEIVHLADLENEFYRLQFLVDATNDNTRRETALSVTAGELVGGIYDGLLKQYGEDSEEIHSSLNKLCVRLVFCLYAEDAGLFNTPRQFHDYLKALRPVDIRGALRDLFRVLDTPEEKRDRYEAPELLAFPYVNGGLFSDESILIPQFTEELKALILAKASEGFNWSDISPTIFGAVFESTLSAKARRTGGMHYTSVENIQKVIRPLFLDALEAEYAELLQIKQANKRTRELQAFQTKLGNLRFFDPACGSGNFLTETYLKLRELENRVILSLSGGAGQFDFGGEHSPVKVQINQFYGIEINDFAVSVAQTALWIAESQMLKKTEDIIGASLDYFPLKSNTNIREGNALRMDWNDPFSINNNIVAPRNNHLYIMGNPPFVGARLMDASQKEDLAQVFGPDWQGAGDLDYVACWFKRAADFMRDKKVQASFVATNSICQGQQVANLWKPLLTPDGMHINFAYRTFVWDSEATEKAHVYCVIVGFGPGVNHGGPIFEGDKVTQATNINGYLLNGPNVFIEARTKPLYDVPEMGVGNQPIDDGNYLFTEEERLAFLKKEPNAAPYFHRWYGAEEFINGQVRYCLWLGNCSAAVLGKLPECMKRVEAVRAFRLKSKRKQTQQAANTPRRFFIENMPKGNSVLIPETSSEKREYVPMGFMGPESLCSNAVRLIPDASLYHFGVLTSSAHMAWMRAVAGRLKSDYRYSNKIVYNNFAWPSPSEDQEKKIEATARAILDARSKEAGATMADLYRTASMPDELRAAHKANDRAVLEAYGLSKDSTEEEIVAHLMKLYSEKVEELRQKELEEAERLKAEKAAERERRKAERAATRKTKL